MYFISYWVRNKESTHPKDLAGPTSLEEAVDMYCPEAKLYISLDEYEIELDVCRDMFGLHEDLLNLMENLLTGAEARGPRVEKDIKELMGTDKVYTLVLTDFHNPPILYFSLKDQDVCIMTRTLRGENKVNDQADLDAPVRYGKSDFIDHIGFFLNQYMNDLVSAFPEVSSLAHYIDYREHLETLRSEGTMCLRKQP